MGLLSKLSRSTDLVNGMAGRLGADLGDLIASNPDLQGPKYRGMVLRCSSCSDQDACTELQAGCDTLQHAPDYCVNKDVLETVRTV
ncbi:DUF6455 family protein [Sedimentitalea sp. JM2-8]|uniref:DUF6455 family protein n=1 Tax=Sedimentitalea xiamensis TaxID=3050037 RepID=A0ABT7FG80_9RHOB|nr:DUF6455 family protein [Sedimentitalea xiamensis]MDK3074149.1 DUF6455 family protein [Sedimentitalea xiamensis]